ncbi:cation transporter [Desulfobacter curvatus]|uniref:cation transporter n=1 Tax=Desulfobacter curvatus TaxID=2290 RepID=UPI00037ED820|nr:cation transporter [Desulfobacter curvatus]
MTQQSKAAGVAFLIICLLTIVKFLLYWISGSLGVLSEAWHSLADIGTTMLVFISIILQKKKDSISVSGVSIDQKTSDTEKKKNILARAWQKISTVNTELKVAMTIGLILTVAAISIFAKAIFAGKVAVTAPLTTGLIFVGLSFGSYFLSRFEEFVGNSQDSAALIADSHHNRADMAISLITGISLILYYFKINMDRWVGVIISLYILTFALELLVNSMKAIIKGRQKMSVEQKFTSIIWKACRISTYKTHWSNLETQLNLGDKSKNFLHIFFKCIHKTARWSVCAATAALVIWWCSTALYTVKSNEKALLFRFGSVINNSYDIGPGLHLKFPYPIDREIIFNTESIQSLVVGNSTTEESAMIWNTEHGDNKAFISGDNNLFLPYIIIHYRVKDYHGYYLHYENGVPEKMLSSLSLQLLNHMFSKTAFYDLILNKRGLWTKQLCGQLQQQSDELGIGVEIVSFCLRDLHPPINLAESFENVVAANQLKVTSLNYAERKGASIQSRERVRRRRTISEAQGYVIEKKQTAQGEAANYHLRYQAFQQGKKVMKKLMYLKSAAKTLDGKKLLLVDPKSGVTEDLLYIENFIVPRSYSKGSDS